jgi:hypothetical protein
MKPEIALLSPYIHGFLEWLDQPQPEGALLTHHGFFLREGLSDEYGMQFYTLTEGGLAGIRFFRRHERWDQHPVPAVLLNSLTDQERAEFRALVDGHCRVNGHWGYGAWETVEMFRMPGEGPVQIRKAYLKGCPDHPEKGVFCSCGWLKRGLALARLPQFAR